MNLTYTRSGSLSSRFSICPLGIKPAFVSRAWDAPLEALVDANSLGVLQAASAAEAAAGADLVLVAVPVAATETTLDADIKILAASLAKVLAA